MDLSRYSTEIVNNCLERMKQAKSDGCHIDWDIYEFSHIPAHMVGDGRWDDTAELLTDLNFIDDKCRAELAYDLINDYKTAWNLWPSAGVSAHLRGSIQIFMDVIVRESRNLIQWPELTRQQIIPWIESYQAISQTQSKPKKIKRKERLFYVLKNPRKKTQKIPIALDFSTAKKGRSFWLRRINLESTDDDFKSYSFPGHQGVVKAVAFIDEKHLVSTGDDGTLRIWNIDTTKQDAIMQICSHPIIDLQISPITGDLIALCEHCGPIAVNLTARTFRQTLSPSVLKKIATSDDLRSNSKFTACCILQDESIVVAYGCSLWVLRDEDAIGPLRANLRDFSQHWSASHLEDNFTEIISGLNFGAITSIALHSTEPLVMVGYSIGGMLIWDVENFEVRSYCPFAWPIVSIAQHDENVYVGWVDTKNNNTMQSSGTLDANYVLSLYFPDNKVLPVAFSQRRDRWIGVDLDAQPYLVYEQEDPDLVIPLIEIHGKIQCAAFGLADHLIATGNEIGEIAICSVPTDESLKGIHPEDEILHWTKCRIIEQPTRLMSISRGKGSYPNEEYHTAHLTPFIDTIAEPAYEWMLAGRFLDLFEITRDGSKGLFISKKHGDSIFSNLGIWKPSSLIGLSNLSVCQDAHSILYADLSPDGNFCVSLLDNGEVVVHDLRKMRPSVLERVKGDHLNSVNIFFNRDQALLILGVSGATVYLLDPVSHSFQAKWHNPSNEKITTLNFAKNKYQVIVGDTNGVITSWSLDNGTIVDRWSGHQDAVVECRMGNQEHLLATCGKDRLVKLWKLGEPISLAMAPCDSIPVCCDLSNDGAFLSAIDLYGVLYSWKMDDKPLVFT